MFVVPILANEPLSPATQGGRGRLQTVSSNQNSVAGRRLAIIPSRRREAWPSSRQSNAVVSLLVPHQNLRYVDPGDRLEFSFGNHFAQLRHRAEILARRPGPGQAALQVVAQ